MGVLMSSAVVGEGAEYQFSFIQLCDLNFCKSGTLV